MSRRTTVLAAVLGAPADMRERTILILGIGLGVILPVVGGLIVLLSAFW